MGVERQQGSGKQQDFFDEALKASLRHDDPGSSSRGIFPAAASEAKMEEAMVEAFAADGHPQIVANCEVGQTLPPGGVMLRKHDLLLSPVQGSPTRDPALEGASHAVGKNILPELILEGLEDRDGQDAIDPEQFLNPGPYLFERI
jgi:hypothetical protein